MNTLTQKKHLRRLKKINLVSGLQILGLVVWLLLFMLGLSGYSGSKITYALFSIVTGSMLVTGFRQKNSYGYLFVTIFLWLGFWLKLTIHTILNYPFVEPVGSFVGGAQAWDEVLYAATVASLGVMLGKIFYNIVISHISAIRREVKPLVPPWYAKSRKWLWSVLMVIGISVIIVNMKFGVHQVGLVERTILIWPLPTILAWLLNIGLATFIAVLLWWDMIQKRNVIAPIFAIVVEAFLSSVSMLSRAVYVFHAIPQLWVVFQFRQLLQSWSRTKTILLSVTFALLLVTLISAVTTFRNYLYQSGVYSSTAYQVAYARCEVVSNTVAVIMLKIDSNPLAEREVLIKLVSELQAEKQMCEIILSEEKVKLLEAMKSGSGQYKILMNEFVYQVTDGFLTRILYLSVDRWIGLEGLMAVQSYPEKNMSLLGNALNEKPEAGQTDVYQKVSNSIYLKSDSTKFRFASLPGAVAFLYYSNSLLIVMLGMIFFSLAVLVVELFISTVTANPIICSLYGALMASNLTQFGVFPLHSLKYYFVLLCGIGLVWMVHTEFFTVLLSRLKLFNTARSHDD